LVVVKPDSDIEQLKEEVSFDFSDFKKYLHPSGKGVWAQASTIGSLEALLLFLKQSNIPVARFNIGPVHKKDVVQASVMLEHGAIYAAMLCFDVKIEKEAQELADETGVIIFTANVIYHLFDNYMKHVEKLKEQRKQEAASEAIFPCILKILPDNIYRKRNPIIVGVLVEEGQLRVGTPLCVPKAKVIIHFNLKF
jgi:translation initiation factor 5B